MASNWLVGRLDYGKRILCSGDGCNKTHQWDLTNPDQFDGYSNHILGYPNIASYGIYREPHQGEKYVITSDFSRWIIKYRINLTPKSNRSTRYYTEYIALCPECAREKFGRSAIDDIDQTYNRGFLEFNPIVYNRSRWEGNIPQVEEQPAGLPAIGSLIRRDWDMRGGHPTEGQIGEIIRYEGALGVAVVDFPFLGERHCQMTRYHVVEPTPASELEVGDSVYTPVRARRESRRVFELFDDSSYWRNIRDHNIRLQYVTDTFGDIVTIAATEPNAHQPSYANVNQAWIVRWDDREELVRQGTLTSEAAVTQSETVHELPLHIGIWIHHNKRILF